MTSDVAERAAAFVGSWEEPPDEPATPTFDDDGRANGLMPQPDSDFDGVAFMLLPSAADAQQIMPHGALNADQLHCTLAFLGAASDLEASGITALSLSNLAQRIAASSGPMQATLGGVTRFNAPDQHPIVLSVDSKPVIALRQHVLDSLATLGVDEATDHGFTPHMTLGYVNPDDPNPVDDWESQDILFDRLRVGYGGENYDFDLGVWDQPFAQKDVYTGNPAVHGAVRRGKIIQRVKPGLQHRAAKIVMARNETTYTKALNVLDDLELKAVRYVRTEAGSRRFGQPIGTVIVADGALPNIRVEQSSTPGWKRISNADGSKKYDLGPVQGGGWAVFPDGKDDSIFHSDSEEDALKWIDKRSKPKSKPAAKTSKPKIVSGAPTGNAPRRQIRLRPTRGIDKDNPDDANLEKSLKGFWPKSHDSQKAKQQSVELVSKRMADKITDADFMSWFFNDSFGKDATQWLDRDADESDGDPYAWSLNFQGIGGRSPKRGTIPTPEQYKKVRASGDQAALFKLLEPFVRSRVIEEMGYPTNKDNTRPIKELVARHHAQQYIDSWADSSGDHDALPCALQYRAQDIFGLQDAQTSHLSSLNRKSWGNITSAKIINEQKTFMDAFLLSTYEATQEGFKSKGVSEVVLHRGMEGSKFNPDVDRSGITDEKEVLRILNEAAKEYERIIALRRNDYYKLVKVIQDHDNKLKAQLLATGMSEDYYNRLEENNRFIGRGKFEKIVTSQHQVSRASLKLPTLPTPTALKAQPLSSWSTSRGDAESFGEVVYSIRTPVENIWSTALTGPGCLNENEFIMFGGDVKAVASGH